MRKSSLRRLAARRPDLAHQIVCQTNYRLGKQAGQDQRQVDLYGWADLAGVEWADLRASDETCDHCGRRKVGLVDSVALCPFVLGVRIVRLQIAGYEPVLYRPTIINELIKLSEVK